MSWSNPFANSGGGLTGDQVQTIIDELTISPVYTVKATAESNLSNFEIVRVNLTSNEINLPASPATGLHIRINNEKLENLVVKDGTNEVVATIYKEICSFYYNGSAWVTFTSY